MASCAKTIKSLLLTLALGVSQYAAAQFTFGGGALGAPLQTTSQDDPVRITTRYEQTAEAEYTMTIRADIRKGWHIYAPKVAGGPTPASVNVEQKANADLAGELRCAWAPKKKFDNAFGCDVEFFEDSAVFIQKIKVSNDQAVLSGYFQHGACNDNMCLPPTSTDFRFDAKNCPRTKKSAPVKSESKTNVADSKVDTPKDADTPKAEVATTVAPIESADASDAQEPAQQSVQTATLSAPDDKSTDSAQADTSLLSLLLKSMAAGLVALLTPCVWPMIPLTVSFFMKRNKNRRKAIAESTLYGLSIVAIFVVIGLLASLIFGANALNALSTNGVLNIIFFLILMAFGLSLVTGKDIALPSSWSTAMNVQASQKGGLIGIFLMAASLCIVSFSCTAPVVGLLLAEVATSGIGWAAFVGMLGFSLSLAIPFAFFALFPGLLSKLPRSGSWMFSIKVILGFAEIALSLKFLSIADMAYGTRLLDRETFIALWAALAFCFALVMWGIVGLEEYGDEKPGGARLMIGTAALAFGIYMIPGLWGAPLNAVSAFVPPMETQDFVMGNEPTQAPKAAQAKFHDIESASNAAIRDGKRMIVFFTGYGCVNCRKMEQKVLTAPAIREILAEQYVMAELYVDDKRPLAETREVEVNGTTRKLRTVGDETSHTEMLKYGTAAQPLFVIVDPATGQTLRGPYGYDDSVDNFLQFIR